MNTFQLAVLLHFESQDSVSVKELQAATQLEEHELLKQVQTLVNAEILLAEDGTTKNGTNKSNTCLLLNLNSSNKSTKFRVPAPKAETQEEVKKTHALVNEDRTSYLQTIIMQIMVPQEPCCRAHIQ